MSNLIWYSDFRENFRMSLVELYKEIWKEPPWSEFFWTNEMVDNDIDFALNQKDFVGKLALDSNNVVGFTWGYKLPFEKFPFLEGILDNDCVYIDELAVKSNFRRKNIGSELTKILINDARKLGYKIVTLRTDVNGGAYSFYKKFGFSDIEIWDPKYPERTYMEKSIR